MIDLDERLRTLDRFEAPDLWAEVEARASVPVLRPVPARRHVLPRLTERRWVAAVVAFAVFAAAGAFVLGRLRFGQSTAPAQAPDAIRQAQQSFATISTVRATVEMRIAFNEELTATAVLQVSYRPPGYREELLGWEELPADITLGDPGDVSVTDGRQASTPDADAGEGPLPVGFVPGRDFSPLGGPAPTEVSWLDVCAAPGSMVLADQEVAGRTAWHLRCTGEGLDPSGPWDLWIDAETGTLLRVDGRIFAEVEFRPLGCFCTVTGFEMQTFEPDVVFNPSLFQVGAGRVDDPTGVSNDLVFDRVVVQPAGVFDGATISSIQTWVGGFLATGSVEGEPGIWLWLSRDGTTWERVRPAPFGDEAFVYNGIASGGFGLVAVIGGIGERPSIWISADARTWEPVVEDPAVFGQRSQLQDVEASASGLVAIGCNPCDEEDFVQAVWTSPDGLSWRQVPGIAETFGGRTLITLYSSGGEIIGWEDDPAASGVATIWTTPDGVTWQRLNFQPLLEDNGGNNLPVRAGPGFVVPGVDADFTDPAVWTSQEGETWTKVPYDEAVFELDEFQPYPFAIRGGPGIVMWAHDRWGPVVWTSVDGIGWKRLTYDPVSFGPGTAITAIVEGDSGPLAIGQENGAVVLWTARVAG